MYDNIERDIADLLTEQVRLGGPPNGSTSLYRGTCTSSAASMRARMDGGSLTMEKVRAAVKAVEDAVFKDVRDAYDRHWADSMAYGFSAMSVRASPLATDTKPIKQHKYRRGQTQAYHARIQKKWTKRYGTKQVPCAYVIDNSVWGGRGKTLYAHSSLVDQLCATTKPTSP